MINGTGGIGGTGPSWLNSASAGAILMNAQASPLPAPGPGGLPGPAAPEAPRPVIPDLSPANDNRMPRPPRPPVQFTGFARALGLAGAMWSAAEVLGGVNDRAALAHVEAAAEKFGLDLNDPNQRSAAFAYAWAKGPESQLPSWMNRTGIDLPKSGAASDRAAEAVMRMELANPGITAAVIGGDHTARQTMQYAVDLAVDGPTAALPVHWTEADRQEYHAQRMAGRDHAQATAAVEAQVETQETHTPRDNEAWANELRTTKRPERRALITERLTQIADENGWDYDSKLSGINGRTIFRDPRGGLWSIDMMHGTFERLNKDGKHLGEYGIDGQKIEDADTSGRHDIRVR